jgi:cell division protein FtsI (penicillin-binding protein 3)
VVRDPARWGEAGLATISYGYGMTATPLQVAAALAAIASGGILHPPHIVKRATPPEGRRVLSATAARDVGDMLRSVMEKGGTGESIKVPGFTSAGKTGTAYKHDPVTRRYSADRYLSSFIGYAPADDPRLVIVVQIDEPSAGKHYGGLVAGPVFAAIASEALKYLGVAPSQRIDASPPAAPPAAEEVPDIEILPEDPEATDADLVVIPDFRGLSVGQVLDLARERGVQVDLQGTGRAIKQFPPAGRALKSIACHVTFDPG